MRRLTWIGVALALLACGAQPATVPQAVLTASVDPSRSGWAPQAAALAADRFDPARMKVVFRSRLQGVVRGQPLVAGGDVYVATDQDLAYRIDGASGRLKWQRSVGRPQPAGPGSALDCPDVAPWVGVLSTPTIDFARGLLYLVARDWNGSSAVWVAHALSLSDGSELKGWPVNIAGVAGNDPQAVLEPAQLLQRPGLLLLAGRLWIGFGSACDRYPFRGWLAGLAADARSLWLWTTSPGDPAGGAGIWQSGGGLVSDGSRLLLATGDGNPDPARPPGPYGQSVLRLQATGSGPSVVDRFQVSDTARLDAGDIDLGSGNPLPLPSVFGLRDHPRLLVQVSKAGFVYLLDRDRLQLLAVSDRAEPVLGRPAIWPAGKLVFVAGTAIRIPDPGALVDARLRSYQVVDGSPPRLVQVASAGQPLEFGSGSPLVTSDSLRQGSALVWIVARQGPQQNLPAELRAYDAGLTLRFSLPIGTAPKFEMPATDGRRIYVATESGELLAVGAG